jgi:ABC-type transport system involved in multi-copper enzyme maturation permease subunit
MIRRISAVARLVILEAFRKKDFYVALFFGVVLLAYASRIEFYQISNVHRYLLEIGLALAFIFSAVLGSGLAARQLPSELQNRTLGVLLSKPIGRFEVMFGKFAGSFAATAACFTVFFVLFAAFAWMKAGGLPMVLAVQTFVLFLFALAVLAALSVGLSAYLTTAANVLVTLLLFFMMNIYGGTLLSSTAQVPLPGRYVLWAVYSALPHFEFFDMRTRFIHDWPALSAGLVACLAAYAALFVMVFLTLGWFKFRKAGTTA